MLGISIYPTKDNEQEILNYLDVAAKYNVGRIFTNLLEATEPEDVIISRFYTINTKAKKLGMEVIIDVAPSLFEQFNIKYDDLQFFSKLNVSGIRLDEGFDGSVEAMMTRNQYDLKIEINASMDSPYLDQIMFHNPNKDKLIACHNFYPQRYTGLGLDYYINCSKRFRSHNLRIATFITSQDDNAYGVWKDSEKEPTLEYHRDMNLVDQYRHLLAINMTDDIIISNCYATEEELDKFSLIDNNKINLAVELYNTDCEVEQKIIFEHEHYVRPDLSPYMFRSTIPRITYKNETINPYNTNETLKRGDIVVLNDNYGRYKGELHIVLQEMKNNGGKNVVGKLVDSDLMLLDFFKSNTQFKLIDKDKL